MSPTSAYVADICQHRLRCDSPGRVVRPLVVRPFPRPCPGDVDRDTRRRDRAPPLSRRVPACGPGRGLRGEHGRKVPFTAMSAAEPGTGPVTFRAMFTEELRAQREQMGLLQREFADKAHVSLSSVKQYEAGKKKPERKFATWCDGFYGCPGTFGRLYDGMIAESYPSWFGPRVLFEDKATRIHEWEMRGIPGLLQTQLLRQRGHPRVPALRHRRGAGTRRGSACRAAEHPDA